MSDDPNTPTIEVEIDGKKHTVPRPAGLLGQAQIDKDYLPRTTVNEVYVLKTSIDDRFKKWVPKDKAWEDQEVISKVLEAHPPKKDGDGPKDLEAAKLKWKETDVDPLLEDIATLSKLVRGRDIREGAAEFFDEKYVKPPVDGEPSYLESLFGKRIVYDKGLKYTVALDEKGNKIPAQNPTATRPYAGAKEFFQSIAEQEAYSGLRKAAEKNNDSGYSGGGSDNAGGKGGKDLSGYKPRSKMSDQEKLDAIKKLGHKRFMEIPLNAKT